MRVLIAEDDRRVAGLLKNRLKSDHISADVCYDGQEALELSGVVHYDVIVLDIMMPKMDGLEAVRRMRERGTDTPVLFLTARDAIEDRVGGLNAGADDYLVKPFAYEELLARIHVLARRQKATGNLFTLEDLTLDASRHVATRGGHGTASDQPGVCHSGIPDPQHRRGAVAGPYFRKTCGAWITRARPTWWTSTSAACAKRWTIPLKRS